jgi:hypothetical protein
MTRDVYAGDEDLRGQRPPRHGSAVLFIVHADADPDSLSRISGIIAMSNLPPHSASVVSGPVGQLDISIEVRGCGEATAEFLRRKLEQLTCVASATTVPVSG